MTMGKPVLLICGGAGYIGSHFVRELSSYSTDYSIVIYDNLSKGKIINHNSHIQGHVESIPKDVVFEKGDIRDSSRLDQVFSLYKPLAVFHYCASIEVGESCSAPLEYWENNVSGTVTLLKAMQKHGSKYFIFSSTAAVFGMPKTVPIADSDPTQPINPYGDTKLAVETLLKACDSAYGIKSICLRYFNACGAHESGLIGECHDPESHLLPIVLQVPLGKREKVFIFGDDYNTHDGTCIRDYIHVTDLASAHIKALEYLLKFNTSDKFNLGSGKGYSVKEIIEAARKVTGHAIPCEVKSRRPGDPDVLIASSERAEKVLGWTRAYDSIEKIVQTAWNFHLKHPSGF